MGQQLYSIKDAAALIGTSRDFISARIADGSLPAFYIGTGNRAIKRVRRDHLSALFKPVPAVGHNPQGAALPKVEA